MSHDVNKADGSEELRLERLEARIDHGLKGDIAVGEALSEIKSKKLYKKKRYRGFDAYCRERWDLSRNHAYRLIDAADAARVLPMGNTSGIPRERVLREVAPLVKSEPDVAREVWRALLEEHGEDLTYIHVRDAVRPHLGFQRSPVADAPAPSSSDAPNDFPEAEDPEDGSLVARDPKTEEEAPEDGVRTPSPPPLSPPPPSLPPLPGDVEEPVDNPVLKYSGSKWRIAKHISALFPERRVYLEPYLGSAAVFLNKARSECEILNDSDSAVANLFTVVRDKPEELARKLDRTPYSEAEYEKVAELYVKKKIRQFSDVERARMFMMLTWQGVQRLTGKPSFSLSSAPSSPNPTRAWNDLPADVEAAARRLKEAQITCRDALRLIGRHRAEDVLIYCDPPYVQGTRSEDLYAEEVDDDHHIALIRLLKRHPGPVFLSGYESDPYDEHLGGWEKRRLRGYSRRGARTEVIWMNDPAYAGAQAADERARDAARRKQGPPRMGMVYYPPPETEADPAPESEVFGSMLAFWRSL